MTADVIPVPSEVVPEAIPEAKPRNVVFILSDDHRYDAMGFVGHPLAKTPHMDAMVVDEPLWKELNGKGGILLETAVAGIHESLVGDFQSRTHPKKTVTHRLTRICSYAATLLEAPCHGRPDKQFVYQLTGSQKRLFRYLITMPGWKTRAFLRDKRWNRLDLDHLV